MLPQTLSTQNVDMEAPAPLGCDAIAVVEFVNKLSAALAQNGVQTSYCIGGMNGNLLLAKALNQTGELLFSTPECRVERLLLRGHRGQLTFVLVARGSQPCAPCR